MGSSELTLPPSSPVSRAFRASLLLICFTLSGCNGVRDIYASGPWGPAPYPAPATPSYSSPWNAPQPVAIEAPYLVGGPAPISGPVPKASVETLEPLGAWASRDTASPSHGMDSPAPEYGLPHTPPTEAIPKDGGSTAISTRDAPRAQPNPKSQPSEKRLTSLTGGWTAQENGGSSCRLHLSSVSALDLYKASTAHCGSKALQNINAWNLRNDSIVLYSRGSVVMRAREDGGVFKGTLEGTGIPITLAR